MKGCFQWFKDTKMKANHNWCFKFDSTKKVVSSGSKILKWKQITTSQWGENSNWSCFQWFKDTKMKANHNICITWTQWFCVVSSGSKILKWKQITTTLTYNEKHKRCFQWFKDTKMKANHNWCIANVIGFCVVSSGSKILKWKQITTCFWLTN